MTKITLQHTVIRDNDFITSKVDDEIVMMSMEQGNYYGLDPVGSAIWEQLDKPIQLSTLRDHLLDRFDVDAEQCAAEMLDFINKLHTEGMIRLVDDKIG